MIRAKIVPQELLEGAPEGFQTATPRFRDADGLVYTLQVSAEDCTGCALCTESCPERDKSDTRRRVANMVPFQEISEEQRKIWDFFLSLPDTPALPEPPIYDNSKNIQLLQPLFEFSGACAGCGETPYLKLLSQLFGDRLLIANATGCSSIYGGNLPTTPWAKDKHGRGPAWSNSLFEDNAEFGFGMRLAIDSQRAEAIRLLTEFAPAIGADLAEPLALPDKGDAETRSQRRDLVEALKLRIMTLVGGREVHPVNVKIGGFYSVPTTSTLEDYRTEIAQSLDEAIESTRWTATLEFPDFEPDTEYVALKHPTEYPIFAGRLRSSKGLDIPMEGFDDEFVELHEQRSHALHGRLKNGGCYHVGPLARFNLNRSLLHPISKALADELLPEQEVRNPFKSIVVRGIETVYALEEALRIIDGYVPPLEPSVTYQVRAGCGIGCSEAPRGICWHAYEIDAAGDVVSARIVPPTSQNQPRIEQDLREFIPTILSLDDAAMQWKCEQAIRNYDPCISCATHFLRMDVERL